MPLYCKQCEERRYPQYSSDDKGTLWLCIKCQNYTDADDVIIREQTQEERDEIKAKTPAHVYGHPANPMSRGAMINKFAQCAGYAVKEIGQQEIERVAGLILHIEDIDDISDIMAYL